MVGDQAVITLQSAHTWTTDPDGGSAKYENKYRGRGEVQIGKMR